MTDLADCQLVRDADTCPAEGVDWQGGIVENGLSAFHRLIHILTPIAACDGRSCAAQMLILAGVKERRALRPGACGNDAVGLARMVSYSADTMAPP